LTRRNKKSPPEKEILAPGIERIAVGKGFTRRLKISADMNIATLRDIFKFYPLNPIFEGRTFEGRIAASEREAKKILTNANLQDYLPNKMYTPERGEISISKNREKLHTAEIFRLPIGGFGGSLVHIEKTHGCRERQDPEWYAAAILYSLALTRAGVRKGDAVFTARCAVELGTLIAEANGLGYFKEKGKEGGKRKRRTLPIRELIRSLIRKNRQGTAADLWNLIPRVQEAGIKIGEEYKFYRHGGRLLALSKLDGCKDWRPSGKPLQFPAFEKRVGQTRKLPTH
jgi:hypothetical protein